MPFFPFCKKSAFGCVDLQICRTFYIYICVHICVYISQGSKILRTDVENKVTNEEMKIKSKVLVPYKCKLDVADHTPEWKRMEELVDFVKYKITTREAFKKYLASSKIGAIWVTEELFSELGGLSPYLDYFPSTLKVIAVPWVGTDFIDGKLLREKDIALCNIGPNAADNVADIAVYLTLSCFRMTSFWEHCFRFANRGDIQKCRDYLGGSKHEAIPGFALIDRETGNPLSENQSFPERVSPEKSSALNLSRDFTIAGKSIDSPTGKNALILGFGSIGQAIGKRLSAGLGMNIHYHKRSGPVPTEILGYDATFHGSLDDKEVWGEADLIVMALPGNPATEDLLDRETLSKCKNGVRIVNVGRGSCVDENALLEALDSGKVNSAGLDVFKNEEEIVDPRFFQRWDVTVLPHIGSAVADIMVKQTIVTLDNIESVLIKGERGIFPVN